MKWLTMRWMTSVALLFLGVAFSGCDNDDGGGHDFGSNDPNVVACIGDSMTEMGDPPWPTLVAEQTGKSVANYGYGGARSYYGLTIIEDVLAKASPGFLVIQFGINDSDDGRPADEIAATLQSMVQTAKAKQSVPVVCTFPPLYGSHAVFAAHAREVNVAIRRMASQEGAELADLEDAFGDDESLIGEDGLHPTQAGNEIIARVIAGIVN